MLFREITMNDLANPKFVGHIQIRNKETGHVHLAHRDYFANEDNWNILLNHFDMEKMFIYTFVDSLGSEHKVEAASEEAAVDAMFSILEQGDCGKNAILTFKEVAR